MYLFIVSIFLYIVFVFMFIDLNLLVVELLDLFAFTFLVLIIITLTSPTPFIQRDQPNRLCRTVLLWMSNNQAAIYSSLCCHRTNRQYRNNPLYTFIKTYNTTTGESVYRRVFVGCCLLIFKFIIIFEMV